MNTDRIGRTSSRVADWIVLIIAVFVGVVFATQAASGSAPTTFFIFTA